jgi:hypothetical protein
MHTRHEYPGSKPTEVRIQEKQFGGLVPGDLVAIPSPQDVELALETISPGQVRSQAELRQIIAAQHDAEKACPVMTGFQLRVVAEAAMTAMASGIDRTEVAPFWRVVKPGSKIAGRLADGSAVIERLRREEAGSD